MKRAFLCGINYIGTESELNGCINDINNINNFLKECKYTDIRILTDLTEMKPTKQNIEDNIGWLVKDAKAGDTLFFHYSGHGTTIKDTSKDESDGKDSVLVPLDYSENGAITDDWLYSNLVSVLPEGVTCWAFTDCCHSGTMLDLQFNLQCNSVYKKSKKVPSNVIYNSHEWSNQFGFSKESSKPTAANIYLFSGCLDPDTSADATIKNQAQGAFTACLLEFVRNPKNKKSDSSDWQGASTIIEMLKEIDCRLIINHFTQRSQLSTGRIEDINAIFNP